MRDGPIYARVLWLIFISTVVFAVSGCSASQPRLSTQDNPIIPADANSSSSAQPRRLTQHDPWVTAPSEGENKLRATAAGVLLIGYTSLEIAALINPVFGLGWRAVELAAAGFDTIELTATGFRAVHSDSSDTRRYCAVQMPGDSQFNKLNWPMEEEETVAAFTTRILQEGKLESEPENISCSSYWP